MKYTHYILLILISLIITLSNCKDPKIKRDPRKDSKKQVAEGQMNQPEESSDQTPEDPNTYGYGKSADQLTKLYPNFIVREMYPMTLQLIDTNQIESIYVTQMPEGAIFNSKNGTIEWIPQKGQAGNHNIYYNIKSKETDSQASLVSGNRSLRIQVLKPSDDSYYHFNGPPDVYKDSEIGYIFIHGKTINNMCNQPENISSNVQNYWKNSTSIIAPNNENRTLICYDATNHVPVSAKSVAEQIINASCGSYNRCVVITHSMGGLMIEFILTHAREAVDSDPEPEHYADNQLFKKVKERLLFVISIASAAGGSKVADLLVHPGDHSVAQEVIGRYSEIFVVDGQNHGSTYSLAIQRATGVLSPLNADPEIPFFMVPGYSRKVQEDIEENLETVWDTLTGNDEDYMDKFDGNEEYMYLDFFTNFRSRSDGVVAFRSACGLKSADAHHGPGHDNRLEEHLNYCDQTPKKANHFVWFLSHFNHQNIISLVSCNNFAHPCQHLFPDQARMSGYIEGESDYNELNTPELIRKLLTKSAEEYDSSRSGATGTGWR